MVVIGNATFANISGNVRLKEFIIQMNISMKHHTYVTEDINDLQVNAKHVEIKMDTRGIWKVSSMASQLHNALIKCYQIIHFWKLEFTHFMTVCSLSKKYLACTRSSCSK